MIELTATMTCDRCHTVIAEMLDVDGADDARRRLDKGEWGCEDEDGNDVCAACWAKWEERQRSVQPVPSVAVDPSAADPGTPSTRDKASS